MCVPNSKINLPTLHVQWIIFLFIQRRKDKCTKAWTATFRLDMSNCSFVAFKIQFVTQTMQNPNPNHYMQTFTLYSFTGASLFEWKWQSGALRIRHEKRTFSLNNRKQVDFQSKVNTKSGFLYFFRKSKSLPLWKSYRCNVYFFPLAKCLNGI